MVLHELQLWVGLDMATEAEAAKVVTHTTCAAATAAIYSRYKDAMRLEHRRMSFVPWWSRNAGRVAIWEFEASEHSASTGHTAEYHMSESR
eukprot:2900203-Amphidinium_carterae.2